MSAGRRAIILFQMRRDCSYSLSLAVSNCPCRPVAKFLTAAAGMAVASPDNLTAAMSLPLAGADSSASANARTAGHAATTPPTRVVLQKSRRFMVVSSATKSEGSIRPGTLAQGPFDRLEQRFALDRLWQEVQGA